MLIKPLLQSKDNTNTEECNFIWPLSDMYLRFRSHMRTGIIFRFGQPYLTAIWYKMAPRQQLKSSNMNHASKISSQSARRCWKVDGQAAFRTSRLHLNTISLVHKCTDLYNVLLEGPLERAHQRADGDSESKETRSILATTTASNTIRRTCSMAIDNLSFPEPQTYSYATTRTVILLYALRSCKT
jgi:hypothetical protein